MCHQEEFEMCTKKQQSFTFLARFINVVSWISLVVVAYTCDFETVDESNCAFIESSNDDFDFTRNSVSLNFFLIKKKMVKNKLFYSKKLR